MQNSKMNLMIKKGILAGIIIFNFLNTSMAQLNTEMDSVSYALGLIIGKNLQAQKVEELNFEAFNDAIKSVMDKSATLMSPSEAEGIMNNFFGKKAATAGAGNKAEGEAFLAENAKKDGVTVLDNGLQYEVIKEGQVDGIKPGATDKVLVHYHGTLIDGKVFDSSVDRGEPIEFGLNQVIKGWTEILQHMPTGSKWRVYIPSDLAYGPRGAGADIGPHSALIFEIELLEVK